MGVVMLRVLDLGLKLCVFAGFLVIQGYAGTKGLVSSPQPSPPYLYVPPPTPIQEFFPVMAPVTPPAPFLPTLPPNILPTLPPDILPSLPPNSHETKAPAPLSSIAPVSDVPAPRGAIPTLPPPVPDVSSPPEWPRNTPPILPEEPPASAPEQNAPPPGIGQRTAPTPVEAPPNDHYAPVTHSPIKAPTTSPPRPIPKPKKHPSPGDHSNTPAPLSHVIPPPSREQAPSYRKKSDPKSNFSHTVPPPVNTGSSESASPILSPIPKLENHDSPPPAPSPSKHAKTSKYPKLPLLPPLPALPPPPPREGNHYSPAPASYPKSPPEQAKRPRYPKMPLLPPPLQALPPPPPHKDCAPLTCTEPLTYGPPESPCACVLPIQVELSLTVALYTFFPLVSELAQEIAIGVFMKQSQVRIMGANENEVNPENTIVLIDLIPLGENFDYTTAYLTFQRFWEKKVAIKASLFGDYQVLYVRYPGLPPSPPLPPSTVGIIGNKPYPGHNNNSGTSIQPLGVDLRTKQHKTRPSRTIIATIILSAIVLVILVCAITWVLWFKLRDRVYLLDPTPPTTTRTLAKSAGKSVSIIASGPNSPPFSLGPSISAYVGSARTFTSNEIERATDNFNKSRIVGEGGFGLVYSAILDDGTRVAMKILKRYDPQGGREFLAEVEMLSRLHHRNLVELIGICVEDRTRCLVYELITNGSVESHLHGTDKETAPLDWNARLKIALGAARGLAYLHEDSSPRVIHRDFKASNILLEDDFTPKVSDFGLARTALEEENKHISTRVMGTFGYVAPEYAMTGHLLVKSDVYSYGVVLLELLTGKKPVNMSQPPGQENLVAWARPLLTSQQGLESIIDPSLGPNFPFDSIAKVAAIASMCVQPEVSHRPFMGEVVQALKLVYNECDEIKESISRNSSHYNLSIDSTNSDPLLIQSPISDYDYLLDVEKDLSRSELLNSSSRFEDSEPSRRPASSGPLRMGKSRRMWKMMGRGSVSEHGSVFRLWPRSH